MATRVAAHPGELLQCSCLPGVVESQHQDAEFFAVLLEVPEEREEPLRTTWATGLGTARGEALLVRESAGRRGTIVAEPLQRQVSERAGFGPTPRMLRSRAVGGGAPSNTPPLPLELPAWQPNNTPDLYYIQRTLLLAIAFSLYGVGYTVYAP